MVMTRTGAAPLSAPAAKGSDPPPRRTRFSASFAARGLAPSERGEARVAQREGSRIALRRLECVKDALVLQLDRAGHPNAVVRPPVDVERAAG